MLSITHIAAGTAVASLLPHPAIFIPTAFALHFVGDALPHWDCGVGLENKTKSKKAAVLQELLELSLSVLFVWVTYMHSDISTLYLFLAGIAAILPDLIAAPANFLHIKISLLNPINKFHDKFHSSTSNMIIGLTPQLIFLFGVYLLG